MKNSKAKLILHPVRMKIIQSLLGGQKLTVQQMLDVVKDVPQATLYRHLNKLLETEVIMVVEEHQVRGTVEKVYAVNLRNAVVTADDLKQTTKEEHLNYFLTFLMNQLVDFEKYLNQNNIDLLKDGVSYRQTKLHLSDEEFIEFITEIRNIFEKAAQKTPSSERKTRNVATIIIPESKQQ
jgi:DNA-binding transcriptional ArsR family regulator